VACGRAHRYSHFLNTILRSSYSERLSLAVTMLRTQTATSTASFAPPVDSTRRQDAPGRYIKRKNLQVLLERLFPTHKDLDFHIRVRASGVESSRNSV
jgi:GT2 family glycosyltransferase